MLTAWTGSAANDNTHCSAGRRVCPPCCHLLKRKCTKETTIEFNWTSFNKCGREGGRQEAEDITRRTNRKANLRPFCGSSSAQCWPSTKNTNAFLKPNTTSSIGFSNGQMKSSTGIGSWKKHNAWMTMTMPGTMLRVCLVQPLGDSTTTCCWDNPDLVTCWFNEWMKWRRCPTAHAPLWPKSSALHFRAFQWRGESRRKPPL